MQNLYANQALAQIRMQERLDEAMAAKRVQTAPKQRGRFGRLGAAIRELVDIDDILDLADLDFVPRLTDYPVHAAH